MVYSPMFGIRAIGPLIGFVACVAWTETAWGDWNEPFESPETTWTVLDRDCHVFRMREHVRRFHEAHSGHGCEFLRITADRGTFVHFGVTAPPCRVIDELSIGMWVRSDRPGIQMLASVVLPRSIHPRDGKPIRTVLRGASYADAGQWQRLRIEHPESLLKQQEASLRFQFGSSIDIREAYIDMIVVNVYGGPGDTRVWIDDLDVAGEIRASVVDAESQGEGAASLPRVRVVGGELRAGERPFFLRIIEHRGEPFAWLKGLGFNCIRIEGPATDEQMRDAAREGVWLIADSSVELSDAAPPCLLGLTRAPLGSDVSPRTPIPPTGAGKPLVVRPLVAGKPDIRSNTDPDEADMRIARLPLIGTGDELDDMASRIRQRVRGSNETAPFVVPIPTEPPESLVAQWAACPGAMDGPAWLECEQVRLLALQAAVSGARGILFESRNRLDGDAAATRFRARSLEAVNTELGVLDPFLSGGRCEGAVDVGDPRLNGHVVATDRATLLVVMRRAPEQQFAVAPYADRPVSILVPFLSSSAGVFELTDAGVRAVGSERVAGGVLVEMEQMGIAACLVATQHDVALNRLIQSTASARRRRAELAVDHFALALELLERVRSRRPVTDGVHARRMGDASIRLEQASRLLAMRDFRSVELLTRQGMNVLAAVRREMWETAAREFPSPAASPFCAVFSSLPAHWAMAERLRGRSWTENRLSAGDMEDSARLFDSGWTRSPETAGTRVAVVPDAARLGRASLRLDGLPSEGLLASEAWERVRPAMESPPIAVPRGHLAQIRGWARVEGADGRVALRLDHQTGDVIAGDRIGPSSEWREWTLYRFFPEAGALRIRLELEGVGRAWIDEVTVQFIDLSAP